MVFVLKFEGMLNGLKMGWGGGGHYITSLMGEDHMAILLANTSSEIVLLNHLSGLILLCSWFMDVWVFCLLLKINM